MSSASQAPRTLAPVMFIAHGSPTFAVEPGVLGPMLRQLGEQLPPVEAVAIVSPHWQTHGVGTTVTARPATIHDFGGFARELYELQYPVAGHPTLALRAAQALHAAGFAAGVDEQRGLDHGAWVPMRHMRPQGDIPVFQVSLPVDATPASALKLGQALATLREQGVLIMGSGSITHNLHDVLRGNGRVEPYAQAFVDWTRQAVTTRDLAALASYRSLAPGATRAHPSDEHYLPLLVALGATQPDEAATVLDGGMTYGMLSMESYVWGMVPQLN